MYSLETENSVHHCSGNKLQLSTANRRTVSTCAFRVEANLFGRASRVFRSYMNALGAQHTTVRLIMDVLLPLLPAHEAIEGMMLV